MSEQAEKVIDPGAEFSAPRNDKLERILAMIARNPARTLAGGEGHILAQEIEQLRADLAAARSLLTQTQELADENDGHAKRHAYEANCLRDELLLLRSAEGVAHELSQTERELERVEAEHRQYQGVMRERVAKLEQRLANEQRENAHISRALFDLQVSSSTPRDSAPSAEDSTPS